MSTDRLTTEQVRDLDTSCSTPLLAQLLLEFKLQRQALATLTQYVQMFSEGDGTAADVGVLISDLREVLDGVKGTMPSTNVVALPVNRTFHCPHCSKPFVTAR